MTKADLAQAVQEHNPDLSPRQAADLVSQRIEIMKECLGAGENVKVSGFGVFELRDKNERRGRNPQTGKPLLLDARRVVAFKASPVLKTKMNEGRRSAPISGGAGKEGCHA